MNRFCQTCMYPIPNMPYTPISYGHYDSGNFHSNSNRYLPNTQHLFDHGKEPFVVNIAQATRINPNFRTTIWTGEYLQLTLMSIPVGEEIGLEMHPNVDQFLRIETGEALLQLGNEQNHLNINHAVKAGDAFVIPAGTWHNIMNVSNGPLKLYSIYAPPNHPFDTVHQTKAEAEAAEEEHH